MIPTMDEIAEKASDVLSSVPTDILSGHSAAGLYGIGFLGDWALDNLTKVGVHVSSCFDRDPTLSGKKNGLPIYSAQQIKSRKPEFMFISARHAVLEISQKLERMGIPHVSCDAFSVAHNFSCFKEKHDTIFEDEESKKVLRAVIMSMLTGNRVYLHEVFEKNQYFCLPWFSGIRKEIYVDAGAYVGDSLERFIWAHYGVFKKIIAFEPGVVQFKALKVRSKRLASEWALNEGQIDLVSMALGETAKNAFVDSKINQMTGMAIGGYGDYKISVESLDNYLKGREVSFIKADVEGMEMPLLHGAEETIKKYHPKLAICVYHYPLDIPLITQYIKSIVPSYCFALRHHSPQLLETVLYAWIPT